MASRAAIHRLYDCCDAADNSARDAFLEKYRAIKPSDLKASTAVLEAFTPGLRNEHAAWFWSLEDRGGSGAQSDNWMQQCESSCRLWVAKLLTPFQTGKCCGFEHSRGNVGGKRKSSSYPWRCNGLFNHLFTSLHSGKSGERRASPLGRSLTLQGKQQCGRN